MISKLHQTFPEEVLKPPTLIKDEATTGVSCFLFLSIL